MRDLCGIRVREDDEGYYVLQMVDWTPRDLSAAMRVRWLNLSYQSRVWDAPKQPQSLMGGVLHPTLAKDLYTLPSEVLIAQATKQIVLVSRVSTLNLAQAKQRVDKLAVDNAKLKSGLDELSGQLNEADKELNELREGLVESQHQLKEQKVDHRKADNELL
ncbi:hypothetical protein B296_00010842 [Ensete ventricosum]|uniref:Uncharacterized protein n=1 Tax=Ensete ventricosum TaxID=4639 RepID=A0A427ATI7_ENSVE|nr:hypothetical protein B296_00010842 [Ensete ventricosum]